MTGGASGVPTIYPTILYDDAKAAIRTLTQGLGFTEEAVHEGEDGSVLHAELSLGNGRVMLGSRGREGPTSSWPGWPPAATPVSSPSPASAGWGRP
ncbi:hypothetical protein AB0B51_26690, partial [Streptomyces griseus]